MLHDQLSVNIIVILIIFHNIEQTETAKVRTGPRAHVVKPQLVASGELDVDEISRERSIELGDACKHDSDCLSAFSKCVNHKCSCLEGMSDVKGACKPTVRTCPFGDILLINKTIVKCNPAITQSAERALNSSMTQESLNGTCPRDFYCQEESAAPYQESTSFCCPEPKRCPVGVPLENSTCHDTSFFNRHQEDTEPHVSCPYTTHYCYRLTMEMDHAIGCGVFLDERRFSVCCPKPCAMGETYKNGKCFSPKRVGDTCRFAEECSRVDAICENGRCACNATDEKFRTEYDSCGAPTCRSNAPDEDLEAVTTSEGLVRLCNVSKDCPNNSYCTYGRFCCPKPAPYCETSGTFVSPNLTCTQPDSNFGCSPTKHCRSWYYELSNAGKAEVGLCCGFMWEEPESNSPPLVQQQCDGPNCDDSTEQRENQPITFTTKPETTTTKCVGPHCKGTNQTPNMPHN